MILTAILGLGTAAGYLWWYGTCRDPAPKRRRGTPSAHTQVINADGYNRLPCTVHETSRSVLRESRRRAGEEAGVVMRWRHGCEARIEVETCRAMEQEINGIMHTSGKRSVVSGLG